MFTNTIEGLLDEIDEKLMRHVCKYRFEYQRLLDYFCVHIL